MYDALPANAAGAEFRHGTFVASRVVYGDRIADQIATGTLKPICPVIDVRVVGVDSAGNDVGPRPDELAAALESFVAAGTAARVLNLSLGEPTPVRGSHFSELAKVIDHLSRAKDKLFVIAAGNIDTPQGTYPAHYLHESARIQPPGEALLALTVGSFAQHTDAGALCPALHVSPFSTRGPGADDGLKPELLAHGGNVLSNWQHTPRIAVYGLSSDGSRLDCGIGTSFAAPLIAQHASRLFDAYPTATTNLVRALLCHFSRTIDAPPIVGLDRRLLTGLGEPEIDPTLYAGPHSVTYLHQGKLKTDAYQHIPFFVPATLASNTGHRLRVRVTVVYNPPVDQDNDNEYSKSRVTCALYKRVPIGVSQVGISTGVVGHMQPWNPVIHLQQSFTRQYGTGEWEIRLRLYTRGGLPDEFEQDFALVVQVIDDSGQSDVYADVLAEAGQQYQRVMLSRAAA